MTAPRREKKAVDSGDTRLQALAYEVTRAFGDLLDLDQLLAAIVPRLSHLMAAESTAILLLDAQTQEVYFPFAADVQPAVQERLPAVRFPADRGIAGWVLAHGEAQVVNDVSRDERWFPGVDVKTQRPTRSLLCVPLKTRRGIIGVLEVCNKIDGGFDADDVSLLSALADGVAIAVDNSRRYGNVVDTAARLQDELFALHREVARQSRFDDIVGASPAMKRVFDLMDSAISTPVTVLLRGETGTGKELIARAIHYNGPRRERPFVAVNCGALNETLLESELFGHRRGAFTGALSDRKGLFEVANGGTILLDEIGDTPAAMQVKLLRVLQEGEVVPVGDTRPRQVDVRVISATHRDLEAAVRNGAFREDLYYRLNTFPISVPPLRQRSEDIAPLAIRMVERTAAKFGKSIGGLSRATLDLLSRHPWPGNVRELQNEIERAVALARPDEVLKPAHFSDKLGRITASSSAPAGADLVSLRAARESFERQYIAEVLRRFSGNASRAAKALGISRVQLHAKIKRYGLRAKPQ